MRVCLFFLCYGFLDGLFLGKGVVGRGLLYSIFIVCL